MPWPGPDTAAEGLWCCACWSLGWVSVPLGTPPGDSENRAFLVTRQDRAAPEWGSESPLLRRPLGVAWLFLL